MADLKPAIICLSAHGLPIAQAAADACHGQVHGLAGRVATAITFPDTIEHLRSQFAAGVPLIGVCASGILIRALAPLLADKWAEPPVLAVAEDGSSVIPLLGGHRGANALALILARALGGQAALTTAGEVALGRALDTPPAGWVLANPGAAKDAMAAILAGGRLEFDGVDPWGDPGAVGATGNPVRASAGLAPGADDAATLSYHPLQVTLGVGCARNCPPAELFALVDSALGAAHISPHAIAGVFSLDLKADEGAMLALARRLDRPFRVFDAPTLEAQTPRLANPSDIVFAEVGCHGVAEGAALAAGGPDATLVLEKRKSANATCALALAPAPLTALPGRKPGRVILISTGPGQPAWRTPEASALTAQADELVGYGLYIDLLGPLAHGKPRHDFPLGGEEDRCRFALERAALGLDVGIVCSGDAGIYAMGALVYELLSRGPENNGVSDAARRVAVISTPGVSALQAAAARAGAPLGHDFCAISLSDLLTPRETILKRLRAAAEGDFVIAFYNPVSMRRRELLAIARDMLLEHRPADTPVLLASSLGRPEEKLVYRRLADLQVDEVDMLTVVLVGASQTQLIQRGQGPAMFTPRGYAKRIDAVKETAE